MEELARIILRTGNSIMGKSLNEDVNIKVELDDSIFVDREKVLEDMRIDVQAGVLKPEIYIAEKYSVSVKKANLCSIATAGSPFRFHIFLAHRHMPACNHAVRFSGRPDGRRPRRNRSTE